MPNGFTLVWRGKSYENLIRKAMNDRLGQSAKYLAADIKYDISHQCDFRNHSVPPDSPFREEGDLMRSIKDQPDRANLAAYVTTDSDHALPLEFGWYSAWAGRRIQPRPFLRRGLARSLQPAQSILCKPL